MKTKFFLYVAIFALAAAACSDDKDTTGPEIALLQPANEDAFTMGDEISIEFELTDPSGINEYKIDIHYAGEGHEHTHSLALGVGAAPTHEDGEEEEPWKFQKTYTDQKGKTFAHVELTVPVPDNVHGGEYHLGILATDAESNESEAYIDIDIEE